MADVPRVAVRPPLMCSVTGKTSVDYVCESRASLMRFVPGSTLPQFFCPEHARLGDEPITDEALFRLVSVTLEIRLSGVSDNPAISHAEALGRLEYAIDAVGGVINLHACRSMLARAEPSPPIGPQKGGRGRES